MAPPLLQPYVTRIRLSTNVMSETVFGYSGSLSLSRMHLLSLESVSKSFPELPVLDAISLGISRGDRIGVIGRNGSGKSTLLDLICGTVDPDDGSIVRAGSLKVSRLDQDPTFGAAETVASALDGDRASIALADKLGLVDSAKRCSELSGGQRKRLALAVTLGAGCDLLILDEPTNHLDVDTIDWLEDHLHDRKEALLLVTHDRYLLSRAWTDLNSIRSTGITWRTALATRSAVRATSTSTPSSPAPWTSPTPAP